jgi:DNA polymerase sigma
VKEEREQLQLAIAQDLEAKRILEDQLRSVYDELKSVNDNLECRYEQLKQIDATVAGISKAADQSS